MRNIVVILYVKDDYKHSKWIFKIYLQYLITRYFNVKIQPLNNFLK